MILESIYTAQFIAEYHWSKWPVVATLPYSEQCRGSEVSGGKDDGAPAYFWSAVAVVGSLWSADCGRQPVVGSLWSADCGRQSVVG